MGEILLKFYKIAGDSGGLEAKMKLAILTRLPSSEAARAPDSPENIARLRTALEQIIGKPVPLP